MKSIPSLSAVPAAFLLASSVAGASIFIPTVYVGDAGNPSDTTGYGAVGYGYYIGTTEVTNGQYAAFLNAVAATDTHGLYSSDMGSAFYGGITRSGVPGSYTYTVNAGRENHPVIGVSFWDAARFANWVTTGGTETGVYALGGVTNPVNATIVRDATAWAAGGVALPNENEWYKAAYYSGSPTGADGDGYWLFPTQSNSITTADARYDNVFASVGPVGSYPNDPGPYGTFDQGGNAGEWLEEIYNFFPTERLTRGGSFDAAFDTSLRSTNRVAVSPTFQNYNQGFRVASLAPIPEPSTYGMIAGGAALLALLWRRRGR